MAGLREQNILNPGIYYVIAKRSDYGCYKIIAMLYNLFLLYCYALNQQSC